jgi:hypothetical protein
MPDPTELRRCVTAATPTEVVWGVLEEVGRLRDWSPSTTAVQGPERLTRTGERFAQTVVVAGRAFRSEWTVDRFDPRRRLTLSGRILRRIRVEMDEALTPAGAGTEICLTMRYHLPFGPLGRLAGRLGLVGRAATEAEAVLTHVAAEAEARVGAAR